MDVVPASLVVFQNRSQMTDESQNLVKNFEQAGFKPQVKPLSHFEDDYGLEKVGGEEDGEEDEEEDDDEEEDESGDESGEDGSSSEDE